MRASRETESVGLREDSFTLFVSASQDAIRHALTAGFGVDVGREAAEEALVYAWRHWDRVGAMRNPAGYVYRVGHRMAQKMSKASRRPVVFPPAPAVNPVHVEPGLAGALAALSQRQRVVVVAVHGYGLSEREAAELLGISRSSVRRHAERAIAGLRRALGVTVDD